MPELGIESADSQWLIRLLETVIMIVLAISVSTDLISRRVTWDISIHIKYGIRLFIVPGRTILMDQLISRLSQSGS
ncbi:hypothetical protein BDV38DRAFT_285543 [Aspergillus pseudotamarii]|uniref:Uncharacterized protein n=1 Tax=Aspergillus pseudotamarii TaxID=132259 RepID=A0A5N6SLJ5_ASPPS|nr:uncharacterized protein BDV38DRAFT_285543 [Aspergillus pseudotamarii]KAE8134769.1 hypothetical protein BDV38DRAFT_285543 [Aspergillus pseudotamarii]